MMKLIRFQDRTGRILMGTLTAANRARLLRESPYVSLSLSDQEVDVARILAPLDPVNIIAIGLNYQRHAAESGAAVPDHPLVFAKFTSSVIAPNDPIILPADAPDEVDYEAELAVVIGKTARKVSEADALDYVLGYTGANDVSARDCQRVRDKQWTRAKSFDTFCPLGPCLLVDPSLDPNNLRVISRLNNDIMQDSNTADMIFSVPTLISYLSHQFTLAPGTVILTGTPEGVGMGRKPPRYLRAGDTITVEIERIGELSNPVVANSQ